MIVKQGGSENVRKLYFGKDVNCVALISNHPANKIAIHFGLTTITSPTPGLLLRHSLNKKGISDYLKNKGLGLDAELRFLLVEDGDEVLHIIHIETCSCNE